MDAIPSSLANILTVRHSSQRLIDHAEVTIFLLPFHVAKPCLLTTQSTLKTTPYEGGSGRGDRELERRGGTGKKRRIGTRERR